MPVSVSEVVQREVTSGRTFVGTVLPTRTSQIGSPVAEQVIDFPVNEGDRVEKGRLIAQLRSRTLEIQLNGAQAELDVRRQELAELVSGSRPEEIAQAKARMLAAKALMTYEKTRLDRYQRLAAKDRAAEDEVNEAISAHERAVQAYEEARQAHALAVKGPRKERIAQARARVQAQTEAIRQIQDDIERHRILAPFAGYIVAEHTEVGEWLSVGTPVVDVVELDRVDVRALVLEDYIRHIHVGAEARVEIGAIPDQTFSGRVVHVVPQADVRSRSFPVKVRLENNSFNGGVLLKAGMFASVSLPVGEKAKALLVLKDAVVLGGRSPTVYVVRGDGQGGPETVAPVPVELGISADGMIQVTGQVKPGDRVVVRGNERLRPGQAVRVVGRIPAQRSANQAPATTQATR